MAESKRPNVLERNKKLFETLEELELNQTIFFDNDDHPIGDYVQAIARYNRENIIEKFRVTRNSDSLMITRIL